jgi:hypothetical protein
MRSTMLISRKHRTRPREQSKRTSTPRVAALRSLLAVLGAIAIGAVVAYGVSAQTTVPGETPGTTTPAASGDGADPTIGGASPTQSPPDDGVTALWQADMEEGSLADWYFPESSADGGDFGGGEFDSDNGMATASQEQAHTGLWSARLALPDGAGGSRLFRWRETRAFRDVVVTVWLYFPQAYQVNGQFWDVLQLKSRSADGLNDPIWFLDVSNPETGRMRFDLVWWHRTLEGPHAGESGFRRLRQDVADIPVGSWFRVKMSLRQAHDFSGRLRIWQGDDLIFDMEDVRTSYENCAFNLWCTSNEFALNNYSDGLSPRPVYIYADDARIGVPIIASGVGAPLPEQRTSARKQRRRCGMNRSTRSDGCSRRLAGRLKMRRHGRDRTNR